MPVSASGHPPGSARDHSGSGSGTGSGSGSGSAVHDHVALDEIELCCELMIAASTDNTERLSMARIDEVLRVAPPNVPRQRRRPGAGGADDGRA